MKRKTLTKGMLMTALVCGFVQLGGTAVHAAELNSFVLDEYVVTANRTSEKIIDTPASVSVVTAQDLADKDIKNVDDALKLTTGIFTNRIKGDLDVSTKLVMRGVGQARQVLVMLDGMPLNDKNSGNVDWNAIPIEVVDRIEVVRGTASSLYGTNAVGGVVNIITKDYDKPRIKVSSGYGSYGTYRYGVHLTQPLSDKLSINAGYNTVNSDGYVTQKFTASKATTPTTDGKKVTGYQDSFDKYGKPNYIYGDAGKNTFEEDNWQFGVNYKIDDNKKLTLKMIHNDYEYRSGTNPNTYLRDENGNPVWTGNVNLDGTKVSLGSTLGGNNSKFYSAYYGGKEHDMFALAYDDTENNLKISAGLNDVKDNWYVSGSGALLTESPSKTWNISVQKEILNTDNDKLVVGIDYSQGETESIDTNLNNWRNRNDKKSVKSYAAGKDKTIAAYFENQHRFDDKWKLVLGGRYDTWENTDGVSKYYDSDGNLFSNPKLDDKEKTMFSPKVAVQYKADEETAYHISWGRSFRAPTVFEMYKAAPNGTQSSSTYKDSNPDLDPETIDMIELGIKKQFSDKTALSATYFHADIDDMIYTMDTGKKYQWEDMNLSMKWTRPENAGKGKTDGIELELNHKFDDNWDMFANYTYQNARITDNPADKKSEGKKVTGIPKELFNVGIGYHKDKWSSSLTGSYSGEVFGQSDNSDTTTGYYGCQDRYFVVNFALHYQMDKNTRISFDINNLLNHEYYTTYVAPDRNYYFSVERTF